MSNILFIHKKAAGKNKALQALYDYNHTNPKSKSHMLFRNPSTAVHLESNDYSLLP